MQLYCLGLRNVTSAHWATGEWILCTFPPRCDVMGKRGWGGPEATGPQYLYSERCHSNTAAFEQDSPSHQLDGHVIHKSSICASLEFAHKCFTEIDTQYNFLLIGFRKKRDKQLLTGALHWLSCEDFPFNKKWNRVKQGLVAAIPAWQQAIQCLECKSGASGDFSSTSMSDLDIKPISWSKTFHLTIAELNTTMTENILTLHFWMR